MCIHCVVDFSTLFVKVVGYLLRDFGKEVVVENNTDFLKQLDVNVVALKYLIDIGAVAVKVASKFHNRIAFGHVVENFLYASTYLHYILVMAAPVVLIKRCGSPIMFYPIIGPWRALRQIKQ